MPSENPPSDNDEYPPKRSALKRGLDIVRQLSLCATILLVGSQLASWALFLISSARPTSALSIVTNLLTALVLVVAACVAVFIARRSNGYVVITVVLINCFLLIVTQFATIYSSIGTSANFTSSLSRLDAIYFALGTLTTAGTGSIAPASELARGLVSLQMVVDLLFVAGALSIAVGRWLEGRKL